MTKQHFIALADMIKRNKWLFDDYRVEALAKFCAEQNPNFNRERWLSYIKGECGSNGGRVSKVKTNNLKTAGV